MQNREIKFRAFVPDLKTMLYRVTVYPENIGVSANALDAALKEIGLFIEDDTVFDKDYNEIDCLMSGEEWYWIENYHLMQFTGMKDKNNKEVYEGDLLKVHAGNEQNKSKVWEVVFYEGAFCLKRIDWDHKPTSFITYSDQCFTNGIDIDCTSQLEVIGNKFENSIILSNAN
jgi:uncharacterized phage protein (TIGR01671 family)